MDHWRNWGASLALALLLSLTPPASTIRAETSSDPLDYVFVAGRTSGEIALIDSGADRLVGRIDIGRVPLSS
jgi:hypothetical protein